MTKGLSMIEYAAHRGIHRTYVSKLIQRKKLPFFIDEQGRRRIDPVEADRTLDALVNPLINIKDIQELRKQSNPIASTKTAEKPCTNHSGKLAITPLTDEEIPAWAESKAVREYYASQKEKLEYLKMEKILTPTSEVEAQATKAAQKTRRALELAPQQLTLAIIHLLKKEDHFRAEELIQQRLMKVFQGVFDEQ